jgi:FSR family fosmidomycin resistance protein-like MFS transporter
VTQAAERSQVLVTDEPKRTKDSVMATTVIGAHGLEHMYAHSFQVFLPAIYDSLGLIPIQGALLMAVRRLCGGLTSMGSGFFVDMFHHRVGLVLAFSMGLIGVGYLLVSVSPTYVLIIAALALASAGSALWHPPALGLLARRYPEKRGLFISLHRSMGNVGDWLGPLAVGALMGFVGWRWIMGGGTPVLILIALVILVILKNVGGPKVEDIQVRENFFKQLRSMREVFEAGGMWPIFIVSAVRGMGDTGVMFVIPLYLTRGLDEGGLDKSSFVLGFHVALLAAPGIVSGPLFGWLSDRIGRRPVISFIMGVSVILPLGIALGGSGAWMTLSVALFGLFHFAVNSLTQAAAIDVAEGRGLEATFIGLMWGSNSAFGVLAVLAVGMLVGSLPVDTFGFGLPFDTGFGWRAGFYFASSMFFIGWITSLLIPAPGSREQRST